jgi:hypothetical protein
MNGFAKGIVILSALAVLPLAAVAQVDKIGKVDTLYAETSKLDADHWTITVSFFNDEAVVGLSVPLRMTAGLNRIVADSAVFTGGRVENFSIKAFRADTAIQCVLLGMLANTAGPKKTLAPGNGRVATIYVSSLEKKPIEKLDVDTTTVNPSNSLLAIADSIQGSGADTTRIDRQNVTIVPAFVFKKPKK